MKIFKSEEAAAAPETVFYVLCDNGDPQICKKAQFKLSDHLVTIPQINVTANVLYDRLVDGQNQGDCVSLFDPPNGFAMPNAVMTVYGRPYGFDCGLSKTHNLGTGATYGPTDVPVYGNNTLAGDHSLIAPAYSLSSSNSNGEAGQAHVDAPPETPFALLTAENAACINTKGNSICVPHSGYSPDMLGYESDSTATVPPSGGEVVVNKHGSCSITDPYNCPTKKL